MWPFKAKSFQLVIEFPCDSPYRFEELADVQRKLEGILQSGFVDGNDIGQGVMNLFIITKHPKRCFAEAKSYLDKLEVVPSGAGVTNSEQEDYVRYWPEPDDSPFILR